MTHDEEMDLIRELGMLTRSFSLCDESEENIKRGERIIEIRKELGLKPSKSKIGWLGKSCKTVKW